MDIEGLNKSQIILLTLLVSFITSIATGIVTVALMDQAPEGVTKTITHVVERTVESVRPGATQVATVIKEVPVIVTEEELVLKAINVASPAVAMIQTGATNRGRTPGVWLGSAFFMQSSGLFVTSGALVEAEKIYEVVLENGTVLKVKLVAKNSGGEVALLQVTEESKPDLSALATDLKPISFSVGNITVGQTVIGIGSSAGGNHGVAMGIVSNLITQASSTATVINTNAAASDNIGGPLVDIKGNVIGLNVAAGRAIGKREIEAAIDAVK